MVAASATGYTILLPTTWFRIPLRAHHESASAIATFLDDKFANPDLASLDAMRERLLGVVEGARQRNGLDAYVPAANADLRAGSAAFIISGPVLGQGLNTGALSDSAVKEGTAITFLEVDGSPGIRRERELAATSGAQSIGIRLVDYFLAVPGDSVLWLMASLSIISPSSAGDLPSHMMESFDEIMRTFRWRGPREDVH